MYFPLANSTVQGPDVGARPTGITGTVIINDIFTLKFWYNSLGNFSNVLVLY